MRDLLISIVVGIGLVIVIIALAVYAPNLSHAWFSFGFFTILLAAVLAKMYWSVRRIRKVWLLLTLFMAGHITAFIIFLEHHPDWPTFWYIPVCSIEVMLFAAIAWRWLKLNPPISKKQF